MEIFRTRFTITCLLFTLASTSSFACHNFQPLHNIPAIQVRGVATATSLPQAADYQAMERCLFMSPPYNAEEIIASSELEQLPDELAVASGGRLTCGFDDSQEFCSWHNAPNADARFSKAQWNTLFDVNRFACTHPRRFQSDGHFLLARGDPSGLTRTAALETTIPCQYDPGTIRFDIWASSNNPVLRYCVMWSNGTSYCENALAAPNPLSFTVPHSVDPVSIRIEIGNLSSQDVILVDSLYYEGRICELIDETESTGSTEESLQPVTAGPISSVLNVRKVSRDAGDANLKNGLDGNEVPAEVSTTRTTTDELQLQPLDTEARTGDLVACEELTCDFNYNHSCFYKLNGFGSTSPWSVASSFIGNRHTGIQRLNPLDSNRVGYAYVGRNHVDDSTEVFVLESPKFEISSDASLTFDVYLRSYSPRLKVCIDSFDDCPYQSPPPSSRAFWHVDQSIKLNRGVRKVYFIATSVRQNQFLAVDRIRVVLDGKPCT